MLKPLNDNVFIEIISRGEMFAEEVRRRSGIYLTDKLTQGQPNFGRVVAISRGIENPEYKVGDVVVFEKTEMFLGFEYKGKKVVDIKHKEIRAILRETDEAHTR